MKDAMLAQGPKLRVRTKIVRDEGFELWRWVGGAWRFLGSYETLRGAMNRDATLPGWEYRADG